MKKLLALVAVGEVGTGLVLLIYPSIVVRLLFAAEIAGAGVVMSRIAGISLIALGIAYFGETHIHTSWSVDAWVMGNRITGPDDAFKYAQGQVIKHPLGFDIKIDTPLDFMGMTDVHDLTEKTLFN